MNISDLLKLASDVPEIIAVIETVAAEYSKLPPPAQRAPHDYVAFFNAIDGPITVLVETVIAQLKPATPAPTPVPAPSPVPTPPPPVQPPPATVHVCPPGTHWIDVPGAPGGGGCVPD